MSVMMTFRITTNCKECGPVSLQSDALRLHLEEAPVSHFSCNCPVCGRLLGGTVATLAAVRLVGSGAHLANESFSPEVLEHPDGPQFTSDHLIDFHNLLECERWFYLLQEKTTAGNA